MWAITLEERGKHDKQFESLAPIMGYVSGAHRPSAALFALLLLLFKSTVIYLLINFILFRRASQEVLSPVRPAASHPGRDLVAAVCVCDCVCTHLVLTARV